MNKVMLYSYRRRGTE